MTVEPGRHLPDGSDGVRTASTPPGDWAATLRDEEIGLIVDRDLPIGRSRRRGGSGSVLAAAMFAVGEIIEPHKTVVEIEETADGDRGDGLDGVRLDFGDLPPLN